jgi:hypothetical protein
MRSSDETRTNEKDEGPIPVVPAYNGCWSWRRLICALRGHEPMPAMPTYAIRCGYCARVWPWTDLFRGHFPRARRHSQRAYDDPVYRPSMTIGTYR